MSNSLSEIFTMLREAEFQEKLANLQTNWADEDEKIDLLAEAMDLIKKAQDEGSLGALDSAQALDFGVALVEEYLGEAAADENAEAATEESAPEASGEAEEVTEETQEKQAAYEEMGQFVGALLAENGISLEDLSKIASEEEAVELAEICATAYAEAVAAEAKQ